MSELTDAITEAQNAAARAAMAAGQAFEAAERALSLVAEGSPPSSPTPPGQDTPNPTPGPGAGPGAGASERKPGRVGVNLGRFNETRQAVQYVDGQYRIDPELLNRLEPFPVIRFMDWQRTNDANGRVELGDKAQPTDDWLPPPGVPLGAIVALCNAAKAHPYICFGHRDSYEVITWTAAYLAANLWPGARVFVEWSNETWNAQFSQAGYCIEQGRALNLATDKYKAAMRYMGRQAAETWLAFNEHFPRERTTRVIAGQAVNTWMVKKALQYTRADGTTVADHADAIALAPYFGNAVNVWADVTADATADQILDQCEKAIPGSVADVQAHRELADQFGIETLIGYELGPHAANTYKTIDDPRITALLHAANLTERMGELTGRHLRETLAAGLDLALPYCLVYRSNPWGDFGLVESLDQPVAEAPKYRAVIEAAAELNG